MQQHGRDLDWSLWLEGICLNGVTVHIRLVQLKRKRHKATNRVEFQNPSNSSTEYRSLKLTVVW